MNLDEVIIEIGTNVGNDTERLSTYGYPIITFEPSPVLYPLCVERFKNNPNILVLPFAIDVEESVKSFNVSEQGDKGYGSLYDFHSNLLNTALIKYSEFSIPFSYKQKVLTMRMDTFVNLWKIKTVKYLWIDAQGNDLNCLKSFGKELGRVESGQLECTYKIPLYNNTDSNNHEDARKYLTENGFDVSIHYVHENDSEIDLSFVRKGLIAEQNT
jgi:FkbM family methyltransferase